MRFSIHAHSVHLIAFLVEQLPGNAKLVRPGLIVDRPVCRCPVVLVELDITALQELPYRIQQMVLLEICALKVLIVLLGLSSPWCVRLEHSRISEVVTTSQIAHRVQVDNIVHPMVLHEIVLVDMFAYREPLTLGRIPLRVVLIFLVLLEDSLAILVITVHLEAQLNLVALLGHTILTLERVVACPVPQDGFALLILCLLHCRVLPVTTALKVHSHHILVPKALIRLQRISE